MLKDGNAGFLHLLSVHSNHISFFINVRIFHNLKRNEWPSEQILAHHHSYEYKRRMIGKAMRKVITNMLFAILIAQFMMAGIVDFKSSEKDDLESISTQTSETSGRQAPHIPCAQFDGMGGPVWERGSSSWNYNRYC